MRCDGHVCGQSPTTPVAILRHSGASSWKTRPQAIPPEDIVGPKGNLNLVLIRRASLGEDTWAILPFCL